MHIYKLIHILVYTLVYIYFFLREYISLSFLIEGTKLKKMLPSFRAHSGKHRIATQCRYLSMMDKINTFLTNKKLSILPPSLEEMFKDPPVIELLKGVAVWKTFNDSDYHGTSSIAITRGM